MVSLKVQLDDSILKIIEISNAQEHNEEVVMFEILHVSKSLTSPLELFFIKKKRNFSEPKEIKNC